MSKRWCAIAGRGFDHLAEIGHTRGLFGSHGQLGKCLDLADGQGVIAKADKKFGAQQAKLNIGRLEIDQTFHSGEGRRHIAGFHPLIDELLVQRDIVRRFKKIHPGHFGTDRGGKRQAGNGNRANISDKPFHAHCDPMPCTVPSAIFVPSGLRKLIS